MEPEEKEKSRKISRELKNRMIEESIIYLSPLLGGIVFFIFQRIAVRELFVQVILSVLASCAFSLFLRVDQAFYRNRIRHPVYFFGCYLLSFFWLGLSGADADGCMWLLLVIFAALDAGAEIAVFSEMLLMLSYAVMTMHTTANFRFFISYFTLGLVMAVLFSILRRWWEAGYLFLILVFFDTACRIFIYDFSLRELFGHGQAFVQELVSVLVLSLVGVFYVTFLSPGIRIERFVVKNTLVQKKVSLASLKEEIMEPGWIEETIEEETTEEERFLSGQTQVESVELIPEQKLVESVEPVPEQKLVESLEPVPEQKLVKSVEPVLEQKIVKSVEPTPEKKNMELEKPALQQKPVESEGAKVPVLEKKAAKPETSEIMEPVEEQEVEKITSEIEKLLASATDSSSEEVQETDDTPKKKERKKLFREKAAGGPKKKKNSAETKILQKIIQPEFPLAKRLRQYSAALYEHSRKISVLSRGAAKLVGGDELLAAAGGLYHEIGRITPSGNYILAGEKIAKEAGFPDSLVPVIRQHSPMFELPKSREAAVVMLSDSIISTEEYLVKTGQRNQITDEHLIQNIFQKRISKGNLKEVDFSEEELEILKQFFIQNLSSVEQADAGFEAKQEIVR